MPQTSSRTRVFSRHVAPFAPIALALLLQNSVIPGGNETDIEEHGTEAVKCADEIEGYEACHANYPTGCSAAGKYDAYLNLLKNQIIDPSTSPEGILTQGDLNSKEAQIPHNAKGAHHADFKDDLGKLGEGHVFSVVGYLYYAKKGSAESVNCQLTDVEDIDFHIGIGFDSNVAAGLEKPQKKLTAAERKEVAQDSFIVEMTPHYRGRFEPDWTLDALKPALGHKVRVVGQLLADTEHYRASDDCGFPAGGTENCWRSTVWEIHPVTQFQVCDDGSCTEGSKNWIDLEDFKPK
jgi:hypothetical protein